MMVNIRRNFIEWNSHKIYCGKYRVAHSLISDIFLDLQFNSKEKIIFFLIWCTLFHKLFRWFFYFIFVNDKSFAIIELNINFLFSIKTSMVRMNRHVCSILANHIVSMYVFYFFFFLTWMDDSRAFSLSLLRNSNLIERRTKKKCQLNMIKKKWKTNMFFSMFIMCVSGAIWVLWRFPIDWKWK